MKRLILLLTVIYSLLLNSTPAGSSTVMDKYQSFDSIHRPWYYAIQHSSPEVFKEFTCVISHESRSHWDAPNLGDNNGAPGGNSGIFQIQENTWRSPVDGVPRGFPVIWKATPREQAIGALDIERADGFAPWGGDGCF